MSYAITPQNDAPTASNNTVTTAEDTAYSFTAADFGFSDLDGVSLASIKITSLESNGALQLSGADLTLNQVILAADIANLSFTPAANANGAGYDSFSFQVQDDGGTANGGVDLDPTANTITIDVQRQSLPAGPPVTVAVSGTPPASGPRF